MSKTVIVPVLISFALSLLLSLIHIFSGEMKIHVPVQVIFRYVCAERCPRGEWSPESLSLIHIYSRSGAENDPGIILSQAF